MAKSVEFASLYPSSLSSCLLFFLHLISPYSLTHTHLLTYFSSLTHSSHFLPPFLSSSLPTRMYPKLHLLLLMATLLINKPHPHPHSHLQLLPFPIQTKHLLTWLSHLLSLRLLPLLPLSCRNSHLSPASKRLY